jgi:hypothetical protein
VEWASVEEMQREVFAVVENGNRVCFASCCHELQTQEQYRQYALLQRLERYREQAIEAQSEEQANAAFIHMNIVDGLVSHLELLLLLKADRMEEAWNELVKAQDNLRCALRFLQNESLYHWYNETLALEHLLFPCQQFVSAGHFFGYSECTICDKEYGECDHVASRLYMGRLCQQRVHDIKPDHLAFVDDPCDKGCRVSKIKREGYMYCTLTLRQLKKADDNDGDAKVIILRAGSGEGAVEASIKFDEMPTILLPSWRTSGADPVRTEEPAEHRRGWC